MSFFLELYVIPLKSIIFNIFTSLVIGKTGQQISNPSIHSYDIADKNSQHLINYLIEVYEGLI